MIGIIKDILGFFTGRTPEYEKIIKNFEEMKKIVSEIEAKAKLQNEEWIEKERKWRSQEEEYHLKILTLEKKVATLEIEVLNLQNELKKGK